MELIHILVFSLLAIPYQWLPNNQRRWAVMVLSLIALGWFFVGAGASTAFLLIIATLGLVTVVWVVISQEWTPQDYLSLSLIGVAGLLAALYFWQPVYLAGASLILVSTVALSGQSNFAHLRSKSTAALLIIGIILLLVVLKFSPTASFSSQIVSGHTVIGLTTTPLLWFGISYLAFRLMGTLLDFRAGRLRIEDYSLRGFISYTLFFPAYTAGPIDRADRFGKDWKSLDTTSDDLRAGLFRILVGILKKFVIADTLALASLNMTFAEQTTHATGLWVMLYLYAFQIFFDFSGYSDVAIGVGRLYGIKLPENFDRPYLQPNIQAFWNHWHMTLSTWFRVYYFNPLSRTFIRSNWNLPQWSYVMFAQMTTMLLIGLWHGITINFVLWGLWHGVGLFAFKIISDNTRSWHRKVTENIWIKRGFYAGSVLLTFHFVVLAWVFFAIPDPEASFSILQRILGL